MLVKTRNEPKVAFVAYSLEKRRLHVGKKQAFYKLESIKAKIHAIVSQKAKVISVYNITSCSIKDKMRKGII